MTEGKGIGFNRNIKLEWLEAAAAFRHDSGSTDAIRSRLEAVVAQDRTGQEAVRKSLDILLNIWVKTEEACPVLHAAALDIYETIQQPDDRIWLHFGLTSIYYPFFFSCNTAIGRLSRYGDPITNRAVTELMIADIGQLGSVERATQRVVASLRDWGILVGAERRHTYLPRSNRFVTADLRLEAWLLACVLWADAAEERPFADLVRLNALYPFQFNIQLEQLRQSPWFEVQRQGLGINMVRLSDLLTGPQQP